LLSLLIGITKLILKLVIVFGGQAVMAWLLYRSRALLHSSWAGSDLIVLGLPLVLGFAAYTWILFQSAFPRMSPLKRAIAILGLSAGGAVISSLLGTLIAFNLYGT
jgi:hypothetical protein